MINQIKSDIQSKMGQVLKFRFHGSRNQVEEFEGVITNIYNYIFTIKVMNENQIKSFTYSDVLIDNLEIL